MLIKKERWAEYKSGQRDQHFRSFTKRHLILPHTQTFGGTKRKLQLYKCGKECARPAFGGTAMLSELTHFICSTALPKFRKYNRYCARLHSRPCASTIRADLVGLLRIYFKVCGYRRRWSSLDHHAVVLTHKCECARLHSRPCASTIRADLVGLLRIGQKLVRSV